MNTAILPKRVFFPEQILKNRDKDFLDTEGDLYNDKKTLTACKRLAKATALSEFIAIAYSTASMCFAGNCIPAGVHATQEIKQWVRR